jgi:hypothetical protein
VFTCVFPGSNVNWSKSLARKALNLGLDEVILGFQTVFRTKISVEKPFNGTQE